MVCALLVSLWLTLSSLLLQAQVTEAAETGPTDEAGVTMIRRRPNIVVILSDDHRHDYLGFSGHPFIQTPHLDRLADEGTVFTNAFVTTSLCSPSRASFLTGQYASTHGVQNNFTPWNEANVTFLELLAEDGYDAAFIGKWHMPDQGSGMRPEQGSGMRPEQGLPTLRGVDPFVTFTIKDGQGTYFNCPLFVNGEPVASEVQYITTELTNRAIAFVEEERERPFVLYLSHKAAHANFLPPPDLDGAYDGEDIEMPVGAHPWIQATRGQLVHGILRPLPPIVRDYAETITGLDLEIGRLLDTLDDIGIANDTVVIYTSDNGYLWGEHGLVDKRWAYDTSMRIPFIVRYPALTGGSAGERTQLVLNIDLAPSVLELAGVATPPAMQGESWAPYLASPDSEGRSSLLYEYFLDFPFPVPAIRALRTNRYKLIDYDSRRHDELFDLIADPAEGTNLLLEPDAITTGLEDRLRSELAETEATR